jgi:hypothetical protein
MKHLKSLLACHLLLTGIHLHRRQLAFKKANNNL